MGRAMKHVLFRRKGYFSFITLIIMLVLGVSVGATEKLLNLLPMYGYPKIEKSDRLKQLDHDFITSATEEIGSRKQAAKAYSYYGWRFYNNGELESAMRRFNQSWLLNPDSFIPYWGFGAVLLRQHHPNKAMTYFEKALSIIGNNGDRYRLLSDTAFAYVMQGYQVQSNKKAKELFQRANLLLSESIQLNPSFANAYRAWGLLLYLKGEYTLAKEKLKQALNLGAKPLPPKIINDLKAHLPVQGINWSKSIVGRYVSEISTGKKSLPGVTKFQLSNDGKLTGSYSYREESGATHGSLSQCTEIKKKHVLICKWKDKYGTGTLEINFSDDYKNFQGAWFVIRPAASLPWNGRR